MAVALWRGWVVKDARMNALNGEPSKAQNALNGDTAPHDTGNHKKREPVWSKARGAVTYQRFWS